MRTENNCLLAGRLTSAQLSSHDVLTVTGERRFRWQHVCWGALTPAHVGDHQAQGAPDLGAVVCLCQAAHQCYDEHRSAWLEVTGISEAEMASVASGLALKYVEHGGGGTL